MHSALPTLLRCNYERYQLALAPHDARIQSLANHLSRNLSSLSLSLNRTRNNPFTQSFHTEPAEYWWPSAENESDVIRSNSHNLNKLDYMDIQLHAISYYITPATWTYSRSGNGVLWDMRHFRTWQITISCGLPKWCTLTTFMKSQRFCASAFNIFIYISNFGHFTSKVA